MGEDQGNVPDLDALAGWMGGAPMSEVGRSGALGEGAAVREPTDPDDPAAIPPPVVDYLTAMLRNPTPERVEAANGVLWDLYAGSAADVPEVRTVHESTNAFLAAHPEYAVVPQAEAWADGAVGEMKTNDPRRGGRHGAKDAVYWRQVELDYQALQLRAKGLDYRSIARVMGLVNDHGQPKHTTVQKMVKRALQKSAKAHGADEARQLDLVRIDKMLERAIEIAETSNNDDRALRAMDRVTILLAQRAKLLGTEAPTKTLTNAMLTLDGKVNVEHKGHVEIVSVVEEYMETLDAVVVDEIETRSAAEERAAELAGARAELEGPTMDEAA